MRKIKTSRFGEIEVDENDLIFLPGGLIGFPELKEYVLLDHDKSSPFKWLQSLTDGNIAFVVINPLTFKPDYAVEVSESEISELELDSEDDAVISTIVTMPNNPQSMTANLKAPLVFNLKNRKGKQLILNNSAYSTRHNILDEMKKNSGSLQAEALQETVERAKAKAAQTQAKAVGDSDSEADPD